MVHDAADTLKQERLAVLAAVMDGDAGLAFDVVKRLMADGLPFDTVLFDIVAPLQSDIGRRWQDGDFGISDEHASTGAIETLVALLAGSLSPSDDAQHVVVACAEGDLHSLPARMVAAYLLYAGFRVTFLGTSVPATDLGDYLQDVKPSALVLSCAMATNLPGARDCIRAAHAAGVPVIAGGRGFGDRERAARLGADAWVSNPRELDELLASWQPDIPAAEATACDRDDETLRLEAAATQVLVDARDIAAGILGESTTRARIAADLRVMVDAMVAAVMTADPEIVREYAAWHSELRAPTHAGYETTPVLLTALHDAVEHRSPTAARYLDDALGQLV